MSLDRQPYPWKGPEDDVIAESDEDLDPGPSATMKCSNDRTNYIQVRGHEIFTDEPPGLDHTFKKGGRGEGPSALDLMLSAAIGCQINTIEQLLHKQRVYDYEVDGEITSYSYTEDDKKRIQKVELDITLRVPEEDEAMGERCLEVYEEGCVVGETLKRAMDFEISRELVLDDGVKRPDRE